MMQPPLGNVAADHSLDTSSLQSASVRASSHLRHTDQIAGTCLAMLRDTPLLVFVHELRFCSFRDISHKFRAVGCVMPEEIPVIRAVGSFSSSLPVTTQIFSLYGESIPKKKDMLIKERLRNIYKKYKDCHKGRPKLHCS